MLELGENFHNFLMLKTSFPQRLLKIILIQKMLKRVMIVFEGPFMAS